MKKHINLHVFRVCIVFGIYPKILSKIMDLTLKFVQFKGYNLIYFLYQPLIKDPQQVWLPLKNFDYPIFYLLFLPHIDIPYFLKRLPINIL